MVNKPIYTDNTWTYEKLAEVEKICGKIAHEELGLDTYPNQIEIINYEQMLDAYASNGLPIMYRHWSFGKRFIEEANKYFRGSPLAYEIVINSNPCISYLMDTNSMTMQTLVIAHACFGHNHFFKNNYLFKIYTDPDLIIDYLIYAKKYCQMCEEKYGVDAVTRILDAAHALKHFGIDKNKRRKRNFSENMPEREQVKHDNFNILWYKTVPTKQEKKATEVEVLEEENLLYFIEKKSPVLKDWEREIVRIVRILSEYFYPQMRTKVMNEGFATFVHYYIINRLWEEGYITDGAFMEFIDSHCAVTYQPMFSETQSTFINPYALGFAIFKEIKRICEEPTEEDYEYFPLIAGTDWKETIKDIVEDFNDETFVLQFLSPRLIREWRMFLLYDREDSDKYLVKRIHNYRGYSDIRAALARQYDINYLIPNIEIDTVDWKNTRKLVLFYYMTDGVKLMPNEMSTLEYLKILWGYPIELHYIDEEGRRVRTVTTN